jgi:uncharacterized protein (TIGR02677 family)
VHAYTVTPIPANRSEKDNSSLTHLDSHEASHGSEEGTTYAEKLLQSFPDDQGSTPPGATIFKPFGVIPLFTYLTPITNRTDWYRAIMRVFFQSSREYRYHLTAQDILVAVRDSTRLEYQLEACKNDLDRLVEWGNLTTLYDAGRVTSIADFRSPILRYQATPEALEIEAFLASHARIGASEGGLHQGDLSRLWAALTQIDRWLHEDESALTSERIQEVADQWRLAFTTWENVTNDAAQYLGSMNQSAQQTVNLTTYLSYKNIVVTYIQSFAQQLVQYSHSIRTLLMDWSEIGKDRLLLELITSSTPPIQTLADNPSAWREDVWRQIEAMTGWFAQESAIAMFSRAARDAVEKVVHRAHALALSLRPQTDYVTMLYALAGQLMQVEDLETAQYLYAAAFASATPIHLAEGLTGSPVAAETPGERSTWQSPAIVSRSLRPIYKGGVERLPERPMRNDAGVLYRLKQEHDAQQVIEQQRFSRLFQTTTLDLGTITHLCPDDRMALTEVIDGCLQSPALEYTLPDGSLITLLNRDERRYAALHSTDGVLILPEYRLTLRPPLDREPAEMGGKRRPVWR